MAAVVVALVVVLTGGPSAGQVLPIPPAAGLAGETILSLPANNEAVIYRVGLVGLLSKASLQQIDLVLSPLAPPLSAGFAASDIEHLRLVESANHIFGDGDDVTLNTVTGVSTDGSTTSLSAAGNATPVGLFPLPVGVLLRHYFVVVRASAGAVAGHAFRVSAGSGHITLSTPPNLGAPLAAANAKRVVIGALQPAVGITPASLDFGVVALGADSVAVAQIANTGAADLTISALTTNDARFTATHQSLPADLVIAPGDSKSMTVTFSSDTSASVLSTLNIVHNGTSSPAQMSLSGAGPAPVNHAQIQPASVDFGNIKFGTIGQSSFKLINSGQSPITISSIASSDPQFTCNIANLTLAPGETRSMPLQFSPTSLGTKTATLSVLQQGQLQPMLLPLRADATVALNIGSLDFGSIRPGKTALLPLTIDNPSAAPVTITSILSDNPAFVPDCSTCVIAAGGSKTIYVTFRPTSTRAQSARLSITHNPTLIVNLAANGFNRDFSQTLDADGKPLRTMAVPFGGEWLAALLLCLYALVRGTRAGGPSA